jgi:hypothetical protein
MIRLHPTEAGYRVLARILGEALKKTPGLPGDMAAAPTPCPGAGVRVDNLWEGGMAGHTRIPVIAGWYTVSFRLLAPPTAGGPEPSIHLRSLETGIKHPFSHRFAVSSVVLGKRFHFRFYTREEGYHYTRSRLAMSCRNCEIGDILFEKMRPAGRVSVYGVGAYVDTKTPPAPGELLVFP